MKYELRGPRGFRSLCVFAVWGLIASLAVVPSIEASTILSGLVGNDLTDLDDNGDKNAYAPPNLAGFDAEFFSSDEPGFNGGEFAFNVFSNDVGGGGNKWCCGTAFPQIVGADFSNTLATGNQAIRLDRFTLTSGNDTVGRDPVVWQIQGSNDGADWTTIYNHAGPAEWTERNQTISYSALDGDTFSTTAPFKSFRLNVDETGSVGGAFFRLNEIELFGAVVPEPSTFILAALGVLGVAGVIRRRRSA